MKKTRENLHQILTDILGSKYVYYQPPESIKLHYPCIVYTKKQPDVKRANNSIYGFTNGYDLTFITKDPDSDIPEKLLKALPMSRMNPQFVTDGLYHNSITVYY